LSAGSGGGHLGAGGRPQTPCADLRRRHQRAGSAARWGALVGDSVRPDVEGPLEVGMAAAHLWRPEDSAGAPAPELPLGAARVTSLSELLGWSALRGATPG
jgi:hypothetical protein